MTSIRPNILHIITDQQRFDTIAALGNPIIKTPNLDRLAREGTVFDRAYSPSPECVPARSCMITGWYPGRAQCTSNAQSMPPESTPTLMSRLRDAGYATHGVGKCHFTPDPFASRGFGSRDIQEELVADRKRDDYARWLVENGWEWVLEPHGIRGEMYYIPQPNVLPEKAHPTRWVGDRCVDFIKRQGEGKDPWYLYAGFIHPHPPFAPPVPWHKLYRAPDMPLPDIPLHAESLWCYVNRFQNRYKYRDRGLDLNLVRCLRAFYYACISFIDAQVGRLLSQLEASGQLENTLILFSADHGEYLGDLGCFGKRGMHDVSARIPMIVRWPGAAREGRRCSTPSSLVDLAPTFCRAAGLKVDPAEFDGVDLRDLSEGTNDRKMVFSQYHEKGNALYMAVTEDEKYVYSAPDQREYFFDLRKDPHEHTDLAGNPSAARRMESLRKRCIDWAVSQGQEASVDNGKWRAYPKLTLPADPDAGLIYQDPPWWDEKTPVW